MLEVYIKTIQMGWVYEIYFRNKPCKIVNKYWDNSDIIIKARLNLTDNISYNKLLNHIEESPILTDKFNFYFIAKHSIYYPLSNISTLNEVNLNENDIFIAKERNGYYGVGSFILTKDTIIKEENSNKKYLIQKYISNPFLIDGKKTNIRVYLFSYRGEYYIFNKILIMKSEVDYNENYEDLKAHIVNTGKTEAILLRDFSRPLNDYVYRKVFMALKTVLINVEKSKFKNRFEIFGVDFLLDANMYLWILEINCNPTFRQNEAFYGIYKSLVFGTMDFILEEKPLNEFFNKINL